MLGASCHREREIWLSCIQQALSGPSRWTNEPASSLHFESRADALLSDFDGSERFSPATLTFSDATENAEPKSATDPPTVSIGLKPSIRRSASVKAIFSLDASSIARRSSHATRLQVDRWLEDVLSEPCRVVRSLASQDSEQSYGLKQARSIQARSNSGLSLSKLGRRESVLGPGKKFGGAEALTVPIEVSSTSTLRPKALSVPRRKRRPILPTPLPSNSEGDDNSEPVPESPSVPSASSGTASNYGSIPPSPVVETTCHTAPASPITETTLGRPKRTRSMVENVRGLFYPRSISPVSLTSDVSTPDVPGHPSLDLHVSRDVGLNVAPALLKWWAKGSLRRRARSSPDVPSEDTIKVKGPPASRSQTPDVLPLSASDVDTLPRKSHLNISLLQRFSPFTEPNLHS
jgi:hypothetical protein